MPVLDQTQWLILGGGLLLLVITGWLTIWLARRGLKSQLSQAEQAQQALQQAHDELQQEQQSLQHSHNELSRRFELRGVQAGHLKQRFDELKLRERALADKNNSLADSRQTALADIKGYQTRVDNQAERIASLEAQLESGQQKLEALQKQYSQLSEDNVALSSSVAERERSLKQQQVLFEQQKQDLSERFQLLASEILDKKSEALAAQNNVGLQSVINPFQQSIDAFKKEVQDIHHRETTQRGELKKELEQLKALNQQITTEAHELSTALRGQKKLQGNWGELVLENVLDRSGLQRGKDYEREVSFKTEHGHQRPDALVYLPQNKHLIIDAKVSLNAYTRYVNSEHEAERALALADHVQAMKARIQELAEREYDKIPALNSPEVVFMFVPIESAFVEALKADEDLFQTALQQNILVATPTTLLTSLNIVRQLWRFEDQNKHTAALAQKAEGVFNKLNAFLKSFDGVKKGLDKAQESYQKAEGQLLSGKANLVKQVADFKHLAPSIKQELPEHFTDKAELEVDFVANQPEPEDERENARSTVVPHRFSQRDSD
ncbi:DNA recombination protein RmuC [Halioxenophilus aromaticivorans]|uniref:DNA recombination protein RmuC n=1 Tax=Halioxenophilus aromaticivorans TaxID=1306992 RepID=A0AAV3U6G9_9ALTE